MRYGERQVAPDASGIRRDHVARYEWAAQTLPPRSRVIDLACGVGYGAAILADAGHRVVAADIDAEALAYGRAHYDRPGITWRQVDAARLAGPLGRFDAAVCFETIEHVADPAPLLTALRQAAPRLLASVPNENVMPWRNTAFHFRHYTPTQFDDLLRRTGWQPLTWRHQAGPESDVVAGTEGRTVIVQAKRTQAKRPAPPQALQPSAPRAAAGKHIAIVALGPSAETYMELAKRHGGRHRMADEVWAINALGSVLACDRVFHMDDVRIQEIRAAADPRGNIAAMLEWLRTHPGPVYTSQTHADYPGLVAFPLAEVLAELGPVYFNSTVAYAVALAIYEGARRLDLYGCDFTYPNAHHAERGRACVEFWLGFARARGIVVNACASSALLDGIYSDDPGQLLYGYDACNVELLPEGGAPIRLTPRELLPTADEIERRYDHSRHPNPLVGGA